MRTIIHLAVSYLNYYKKQTMTLCIGIVLALSLLTGMGSLFESGNHTALEQARKQYGDWHYNLRCDENWMKQFEENPDGKGYKIEKAGIEIIRKVLEKPFSIQLVYVNDAYLDMMGRKLQEGSYPQKENEVAMDKQTLLNLGIPEVLGTTVVLNDESFVLSGIVSEAPEQLAENQNDAGQIFVSKELDYGTNGSFLYLKFAENHKVYQQMEAFCRRFKIKTKNVTRNNGIASYVGGEIPTKFLEVIKTGITHKEAGLPYIWGQLNETGVLVETVVLIVFAVFGTFIIYSLFQISVVKRMAQYGMMQTLGMAESQNRRLLETELGMVTLSAYPVGCILGNLTAWVIYRKIGRIFIVQNQTYHSGIAELAKEQAISNLPKAGAYCVNKTILVWSLLFLILIIWGICTALIKKMEKQTIHQMMNGHFSNHKNRKIYSLKHKNLTKILTKKFMFGRKGTLIGILLSLSLGSVIFLSACYVTENTKKNNELTFKADDGLGSDIQLYEQSEQLSDVIPKQKIEEIKKISGVKEVHPVQYLLGELPLENGKLLWTSYFADIAEDESNPPDEALKEKYNGIAVRTGENSYTLKVNIYGYDDEMIADLKPYLLEGTIDAEEMREKNLVILKTLVDGQGNYDGIDILTGDEIQLKTVKNLSVPEEALKFLGEEEWYQQKTLKVSAIVSRPLAKVENFIGDDGETAVDIIMTKEQMEKNFGVSDDKTVSISVDKNTDTSQISKKLREITADVNQCIVKDYSQQIEAQNLYLAQKMFFYYGISAVLMAISLLHIMNSMQYLVFARKREFGILRAMGITDAGFQKMLLREGIRYGMYSTLVVSIFYLAVQKILYYFMVHVYRYLHPNAFLSWYVFAGILIVNVVLCVIMMQSAGRTILKEEIVKELKEA